MNKIKIANKEYELRFEYSVLIDFATDNGIEYVEEAYGPIQEWISDKKVKISTIKQVASIVKYMVVSPNGITEKDIVNAILGNQDNVSAVINEIVAKTPNNTKKKAQGN